VRTALRLDLPPPLLPAVPHLGEADQAEGQAMPPLQGGHHPQDLESQVLLQQLLATAQISNKIWSLDEIFRGKQ
jgi:hypothetical protein